MVIKKVNCVALLDFTHSQAKAETTYTAHGKNGGTTSGGGG